MDSLLQLIKTTIAKELPITISSGKVIKVGDGVCDVEREGFPTLYDVRLNAIEGTIESFFRVTPKVGSVVLVGLIENKKEEAFVVATSEIEKVEAVFGNDMSMLIDETGCKFNDGSNGGMTITPTLVAELDKNNAILNAILQVLSTPVNEPGNGAPSVLQSALNSAVSGLPVGDFSNVEDSKVTH